MKEALTNAAPVPAPPYSRAVAARGLIFVSGQRPVDPRTGQVVVGFEQQTHQVFANVRTALRAGGADLADIVKVSVYLSDLANFDQLNEIYRQYFQEPYPARTTIGATLRGILIEIDAIAVQPAASAGDQAPPFERL